MPVQPGPLYPHMTTFQSSDILNHLIDIYGITNICWPVIWYNSVNMDPLWLTFEVNAKNQSNANLRTIFFQQGSLPEYLINYLELNRQIVSFTGQTWLDPPGLEIIGKKFSSTYDYIVNPDNTRFNTIDIDYVWNSGGNQYHGLEVTTFYVPMDSENRAKYLVGKFIEKRASVARAHQFRILARVAQLEHIRLNLVFVNVESKYSTKIRTDGNVFVIPLDSTTAEQLHKGEFPSKYQFLPWRTWISSL